MYKMKVPKNANLSSKATEYVERFSTGCQGKSALKKIVEYREECKAYYNTYPNKDTLNRIVFLAEARDYITNKIKEAEKKKEVGRYKSPFVQDTIRLQPHLHDITESHPPTINMRGSRPPPSTNKNKITSADFTEFERRMHRLPDKIMKHAGYIVHDDDLNDIKSFSWHDNTKKYYRYDSMVNPEKFDEHELKYVMRFQVLAQRDPNTGLYDGSKCRDAIYSYQEEQQKFLDDLDTDDEEGQDFHQTRIDALDRVISHFDDIDTTIMSSMEGATWENVEYVNGEFGKNYDNGKSDYVYDEYN